MDSLIFSLRITGILAIFGAILYAVGDVIFLASKASLDDYPKLKPYAKLLSDAEKMVVLSPNRMIWGALLGVFATPLVLAGFWQVYHGLAGENEVLVLTTALLFGIASVIGAFVHGTFDYMGEYVQALNMVDEFSQVIIADMIKRHRKVLILKTNAPLPDFHHHRIHFIFGDGRYGKHSFPRMDGGYQPCHNDHCMAVDQTHPTAICPRHYRRRRI